jgi:hypothetical protein
MENYKWKSVAFPYGMSCGLGGGSWNIIYAMICDVFESSDIEVKIVVYDKTKGVMQQKATRHGGTA